MLTRNPERTAWLTLLGAQLICLIMTATGFTGGWWFFFESSTGLQTDIKVGQGSIGVYASTNAQEETIRLSKEVGRGEIIRTAQGDQGSLEFYDSRENKMIASVTIFADSQVRLITAQRPRYSFTDASYKIELSDIQGRIEIRIAPDIQQHFSLVAKGTYAEIHLTDAGVYSFTSDTARTTLWARSADGEIKPYGGERTRVFAGYRGVVDVNQPFANIVITHEELVADGFFNNLGQPGGWACYPGFDTYKRQIMDARHVMYINRQVQGHDEVGCRQYLGGDQGLDVTGYRTLRVRSSLKILDQSLTLCGDEASECPLMIEITYINQYGVEGSWYIHGIYTDIPGRTLFPVKYTTCQTCITEHDRIMANNWFTFESPNLLELPPEYRPTRIKQIRFYSSGHSYEVAVGEVSLIAER